MFPHWELCVRAARSRVMGEAFVAGAHSAPQQLFSHSNTREAKTKTPTVYKNTICKQPSDAMRAFERRHEEDRKPDTKDSLSDSKPLAVKAAGVE